MNDDEQRRIDEENEQRRLDEQRQYEEQQRQQQEEQRQQQEAEDKRRQEQHRIEQSMAAEARLRDEAEQRNQTSAANQQRTNDYQQQHNVDSQYDRNNDITNGNNQDLYNDPYGAGYPDDQYDPNELNNLFNDPNDPANQPDDEYLNSLAAQEEQQSAEDEDIDYQYQQNQNQNVNNNINQINSTNQGNLQQPNNPGMINTLAGGAAAAAAANRLNQRNLNRAQQFANRRNGYERRNADNRERAKDNQEARLGGNQSKHRRYLMAIDPTLLASKETMNELDSDKYQDTGQVMDKLREDLPQNKDFQFVSVNQTKETEHQMRIADYMKAKKTNEKGLQPTGEKFKTVSGLTSYVVVSEDWLREHKDVAKQGAGFELDSRIDPQKLSAQAGVTKRGDSVDFLSYGDMKYPLGMTIPGNIKTKAQKRAEEDDDDLFENESLDDVKKRAQQEEMELRRRPKNKDYFRNAKNGLNQQGMLGMVDAFITGYSMMEEMRKTKQAKNDHQDTLDKMESMKAQNSQASDSNADSQASNAESSQASQASSEAQSSESSAQSSEAKPSSEATNESKVAEQPAKSLLQRAGDLKHDFINRSILKIADVQGKQADMYEQRAKNLRDGIEELNQEVTEDEAARYGKAKYGKPQDETTEEKPAEQTSAKTTEPTKTESKTTDVNQQKAEQDEAKQAKALKQHDTTMNETNALAKQLGGGLDDINQNKKNELHQ